MPDLTTSAAIAASGIPVVIFTGAIGLDPINMGAGLVGVVIAQTLLPPTVSGVGKIIGLGIGSTLLASVAAPLVAPALSGMLPWLSQIDPSHIKSASAALVGAFAQPLLVWIKGKIPTKAPTLEPEQ